jgi:capsule biosynthesis phosphatase
MRICIDIDGAICSPEKLHQTYEEVFPVYGTAEKIKQLKDKGYYIILSTARHMNACESNVGLAEAKEGLTLLQWLKKYNFVYDEIWFSKPYAQVYIDKNTVKFEGSWDLLEAMARKKDL